MRRTLSAALWVIGFITCAVVGMLAGYLLDGYLESNRSSTRTGFFE